MKTYSLRIGGLALAGLFFSLFPLAASTETPVPIFDKKAGFVGGWAATTWGEVSVEPSRTMKMPGGAMSLQVSAVAGSVPYAGLQLIAGAVGGIELDEQQRNEGVVQLQLRNGNDAAGQPTSDQEVQVMLSFAPAGGKVLSGQYQRVVLEPTPVDGSETDGWQTVTVSIPGMLRGRADSATPLRLRGVYIQYIDQPQAGFYIGECVIRSTAK